ncbi:MAG: MopE-related protein, partial [Myxococcota bacterium]
CNTFDDDCDGTVDEASAADAPSWYVDADRDGYGNAAISAVQCSAPTGYVSDATDCLDTSAVSYPGADELCDSLDNDCDGTVDDNPSAGVTYYRDADVDGFGDPDTTTEE